MKRFMAAFARHTVFANILMIMILFAGFMASISMVRELFPEMSIDMVTISVIYPGADPEEVEEGISRKIEEAIDGLEGIKRYTTQSFEGRSAAMVEIIEGYDLSKAKDDIKTRVDAINTLPVDAERPIVNEVTITREVLSIALSGPLDERRLKEWAETIKDEIRALPEVSQVDVVGTREYEISIEVSEEQLRKYGLTFTQVATAVRTANMNMAGGTLRTEGEEIRLRTVGRKYWGDEFRKIVVLAQPEGEIVTLGQIADVHDGFVEDPLRTYFNGEPAVGIQVSKTTDEDAITISDAVNAFVARKQAELPEGISINVWSDSSEFIRARINLLLKNGAIGLLIVFLLLWLFLDLRLSFWASMGIPISLTGALAVLYFVGGTINMMSLFGLIMVLGIVVDDAIVVGEAIYYHRKRGDAPLLAAVNGTIEVGMPVIAAVTTTVVAFLPLMFVGGIMGKFIQIMPIAVISALMVSMIECFVMLPSHLSHLPDLQDPARLARQRRNPLRRFRLRFSEGMEWFVEHVYQPSMHRVIAARYLGLCVAIAIMLITIGMVRAGIVKYVMFPTVDGNSLTATIEFPNGTPVEVTERAVARIDAAIDQLASEIQTPTGLPLVKSRLTQLGASLGERASGEAGSGTHVGSVRIEMYDSAERGIHSDTLRARWEETIGPIAGAVALTIEGGGAGPPGKPVEIWVQGRDMEAVLAATDEVIAKLEDYDGVSQVASDFRPGKNEIQFELKPEGRALGITVSDLARQVFAGFFGEEAMRLQRGRDDIRVRIRYPLSERNNLSELAKVRIRTPQGHEVPLESVATASYGPGYAGITRTDGMRRVAVSAEVDNIRANAEEVVADLEATFVPDLIQRYPGINVSQQGSKADTAESMQSLFIGFPLALLGIFVIIATVFRSYAQPFIIMLTVPFGIIGAVLGHLVMGEFLTMMSLFGIVALAGVVVNDAIVLIECVNTYIAKGVPFFDALPRAGARRFRAIFLTTASTVGGLGPMIIETDFQARFLIPMAISIAAGVSFATLLTLVLIPCLLGILNDLRRAWVYMRTGIYPDPNSVEPASTRLVDDLNGPEAEEDYLETPGAASVNLSET